MSVKICNRCRQEKPLTEFYRELRKGRRPNTFKPTCKTCIRALTEEWRKNNPDRVRVQVDRARGSHRKRAYGVTPFQYEAMLKAQNGTCAICCQPERRRSKKWVTRELCVDHDHATGKVRGLLCSDCNVAISLLRENPELLDAARDYLLRSKPIIVEAG